MKIIFEFIRIKRFYNFIPIVFIFIILLGCATTQTVSNVPRGKKHSFTNLTREAKRDYAESRLIYQSDIVRRYFANFLHFLNQNQTEWLFRFNSDFTIVVGDEKHFLVTSGIEEPYSFLWALGSILAINGYNKKNVIFSCYAILDFEYEEYGWSAAVSDWFSYEENGQEELNWGSEEKKPQLDEMAENLDSVLEIYFDTAFGRTIFGDSLKDHMLYNPIFRSPPRL